MVADFLDRLLKRRIGVIMNTKKNDHGLTLVTSMYGHILAVALLEKHVRLLRYPKSLVYNIYISKIQTTKNKYSLIWLE